MFPFEIHSHTSEHSACSYVSAEELMDRAAELGLSGIVVTDHHYQWPQAELQAIADRVTGNGLVALSAYEVSTRNPRGDKHAGDILVYGADENREPMEIWTYYEDACTQGHEQDALLISAHPFREGMGSHEIIYELDVDGLEIYNQNHSQLNVTQAKEVVLRRGFLGVAGSDAHSRVQVGQFLTVFDRPVRNMTEFITELRARRYALQSNRPDIK